MSAKQPLNELAERRRLLVLEADLLRRCLGLERQALAARWAGLKAAPHKPLRHSPLLMAGGAGAILFAMRRGRALARWLPVVLIALRWLRILKGR
jgi:hypothetical protein